MARRVRFGNKDFSTWVSNIKSDVAEEAAEAIIRQLQIKGPYWTGNFAGAWEARLGDVEIPADKQSLDRDRDFPPDRPGQTRFTDGDVFSPSCAKGCEGQYRVHH